MEDNWKHRSAEMRCRTCMYFVPKQVKIVKEMELKPGMNPPSDPEQAYKRGPVGRCRRNAPTMKGWPVLFGSDWCGEHKLDENAI